VFGGVEQINCCTGSLAVSSDATACVAWSLHGGSQQHYEEHDDNRSRDGRPDRQQYHTASRPGQSRGQRSTRERKACCVARKFDTTTRMARSPVPLRPLQNLPVSPSAPPSTPADNHGKANQTPLHDNWRTTAIINRQMNATYKSCTTARL